MCKPITLFRTTNWSSSSRSLKCRCSLVAWFALVMSRFAARNGTVGHPETFSAAATRFCLLRTVLFGLPLRQTTRFVGSLLARSGLDWPVPDYTTLWRRQKHLKVGASSGPRHLLVDSTGIKFSGEGAWQVCKHGASRPRQWRKIHSGIDAATSEVRAAEIVVAASGMRPFCPACWLRFRLKSGSTA